MPAHLHPCAEQHPQACACERPHAPGHVRLCLNRDVPIPPVGTGMPLPQAQAVLACGREGMLLGDSHMMLFLSFRMVVGSSLGVCGVPRVVEALVESLSKASMSGDWGELSMRLATSALWYCCRVTWAHRHACQAQQGPRPTGTS